MSNRDTAKGPGYFASPEGWRYEEGDWLRITDGMSEVEIRFTGKGSGFTDIPLGTDNNSAMASKIAIVVNGLAAAGFGVSAAVGNNNKHYVKLYADAEMSTAKPGFSVNDRLQALRLQDSQGKEVGVMVSNIPSGTYDCGKGTGCRHNADCESRICCVPQEWSGAKLPESCAGYENGCAPSDCGDGVRNGTETAADCGGNNSCDRCDVKKFCVANSDCESRVCCLESGKPQYSGCATENANTCLAARCDDGVQNQGETEAACGGPNCRKTCAETQICTIDDDCQADLKCVGTPKRCTVIPTQPAAAGAPAVGG